MGSSRRRAHTSPRTASRPLPRADATGYRAQCSSGLPGEPKPIVVPGNLWMALFAAIAKETPWVAIVGAGLVAAAEIFISRRKK